MRVARAGTKKKSNDGIALPAGARNSSPAASGNRSPSLTMAEARAISVEPGESMSVAGYRSVGVMTVSVSYTHLTLPTNREV